MLLLLSGAITRIATTNITILKTDCSDKNSDEHHPIGDKPRKPNKNLLQQRYTREVPCCIYTSLCPPPLFHINPNCATGVGFKASGFCGLVLEARGLPQLLHRLEL